MVCLTTNLYLGISECRLGVLSLMCTDINLTRRKQECLPQAEALLE